MHEGLWNPFVCMCVRACLVRNILTIWIQQKLLHFCCSLAIAPPHTDAHMQQIHKSGAWYTETLNVLSILNSVLIDDEMQWVCNYVFFFLPFVNVQWMHSGECECLVHLKYSRYSMLTPNYIKYYMNLHHRVGWKVCCYLSYVWMCMCMMRTAERHERDMESKRWIAPIFIGNIYDLQLLFEFFIQRTEYRPLPSCFMKKFHFKQKLRHYQQWFFLYSAVSVALSLSQCGCH